MTKMINKCINEIKDVILSNLQRIVPQITDVEIAMDKTYNGKDYVKIASTFFRLYHRCLNILGLLVMQNLMWMKKVIFV